MLREEKVSDVEIVLIVAGPLFSEAGIEFEKKMDSLCETAFPTVTLDLSMALGITSSAIGKLLSVHKRLVAQNRRIRISGCSEALLSVFQKIKLDTLIPITRQSGPKADS
jgi:anti-anti-sigma regulatory factor